MEQWTALALTLACEVPLVALCARSASGKTLTVAATASLITHPLAWHLASLLSPHEYTSGIWMLEAAIVVIEAIWYRLWLAPRLMIALGWSLLANSASFGIGWWLLST